MSNAVTGSVALTELKNDLTRLSDTLHTIYDLMSADMTQVGQAWQDGKYQEFVDGYKPQINKCEEISERYKEWCLRVLDPTIENVIAVEKTDVVSGGGSAVGGASAAGSVGGAGASAVGMGFNMTKGNEVKLTTKAVPISNGCGSEVDKKSSFFASIAKRQDAKHTGTSIDFQNASCDQHDKDYFSGVPQDQADGEFEQRSPIMGAAVKGNVGTAFNRFMGKEDSKLGTKIGSMYNESAKATARESYANAQKDREISQKLQSTWEEEHQQSLDSENYRVDVEEGGFSKF